MKRRGNITLGILLPETEGEELTRKQRALLGRKRLVMHTITNILRGWNIPNRYHENGTHIDYFQSPGNLDESIDSMFSERYQQISGLIMVGPYMHPESGEYIDAYNIGKYIRSILAEHFPYESERDYDAFCNMPKFIVNVLHYDNKNAGNRIYTMPSGYWGKTSSILLKSCEKDSSSIMGAIGVQLYIWLQDAFPEKAPPDIMQMCAWRWGLGSADAADE